MKTAEHLSPEPLSECPLDAESLQPIQLAPEGSGPLLQRDYVIVLDGSPCSPEDAIERLRSDFPRFSPETLARFSQPAGTPLHVGDVMTINMRGYGCCEVEVMDIRPRCISLRTIRGHVEAGRISFGAYRDEAGRLVCRIRSRARSGNPLLAIGHALLGKHLQTRIWCTFLERLAESCGGKMLGGVLTETEPVTDSAADAGERECPTIVTENGA